MRTKSSTGIYHVMCRGNNKQSIFLDDGDSNKYYFLLAEAKQKYDFDLYAFCFMSNHVHLVVCERTDSISDIMRYINSGFGSFINWKHERVGHLFQNRFRSEPIENDGYLLSAVRYVHNNPVKAEIVSSPEEYYWNSYRGYLDSRHFSEVLDTDFVMGYFKRRSAKETMLEFIRFSHKDDDILLSDEEENIEQLKETYVNMVGKNSSADQIEKVVLYMKRLGYPRKKVKDITGMSDYSIRKIYNI